MTTADTIKLFRVKLKKRQILCRLDKETIDSCIHDAIIKLGEEQANSNHKLLWYVVQNVITDNLRVIGPYNRDGSLKSSYVRIMSLDQMIEDYRKDEHSIPWEPQYPDCFDIENSRQYNLEKFIQKLTPVESKIIRNWYIAQQPLGELLADLDMCYGSFNYVRGKALMKLREMIERPNCNPDKFEAPDLKDLILDSKYQKRHRPAESDQHKEEIRKRKRLSCHHRRKSFLAKPRRERPELFRNGRRYWVRGVKRGKKKTERDNSLKLSLQTCDQESVHSNGDAKVVS